MARDKVHTFSGDGIDIHYNLKRCIHASECVTRLREVFDNSRRPWIQPNQASAAQISETIQHCPTGALHYHRKDGGGAEIPDKEATIRIQASGPLYVRGAITIKSPDGTVLLEDSRVALCRCGASKNKPFCDNSHFDIEFKARDNLAANMATSSETPAGVRGLTITPDTNGPYHIEGDFTIYSTDKSLVFQGHDAWLCRCGGSNNKPFCDSTHKKNGFQSA